MAASKDGSMNLRFLILSSPNWLILATLLAFSAREIDGRNSLEFDQLDRPQRQNPAAQVVADRINPRQLPDPLSKLIRLPLLLTRRTSRVSMRSPMLSFLR